jgi:hypothetical protein
MANLDNFRVTALLTRVLATQYNRVVDAIVRGEMSNSETLTANKTLVDADFAMQTYAPTAARNVTLPAVAAANHPFVIVNTSSLYALTVKNAGATIIGIVPPLSAREFVSSGSVWYASQPLETSGPAGFLRNGKIAVSVASDDLTLAITDLYGNTPSPENPVKVRIGNSERAIMAALSVTCADGTNWAGLGSAETATLEQDLFAYLVWNTALGTPAVDIFWSRIPSGSLYSDFSGTVTNDRYAAVNATPPNATDECVNIGRFAATLSAGAGYTWSVPTFTNANLKQRPTFDTRWLTWAPTIVGYSTNPSDAVYTYKIENDKLTCLMRENVAGTSNNTTTTYSLPLQALTTTNLAYTALGSGTDNGVALTSPCYAAVLSGSAGIAIYKDLSLAPWTNSGDKRIRALTLITKI